MKETTLLDVYRILAESVRFYDPAVGLRPNTFAVLNHENDLTTGNLGFTILDKNKPIIYSRAWEEKEYNPSAIEWSYPIITVFEEGMVHEGLFQEDNKYRYWNISLNAYLRDWHHLKDDEFFKSKDIPYKTRPEQYLQAEDILINIIRQLRGSVYATTSEDATKRLYNPAYLTYLAANVPGFTYTIDVSKKDIWRYELIKFNPGDSVFSRAYLTSLNAVWVGVNLKIPVNCYTLNPDQEFYMDYGITFDHEVGSTGGGGGGGGVVCRRYLKTLVTGTSYTVTFAEHGLTQVSGANIFDSSGDEIVCLVNINQGTGTVIVTSNLNFANHQLIIY